MFSTVPETYLMSHKYMPHLGRTGRLLTHRFAISPELSVFLEIQVYVYCGQPPDACQCAVPLFKTLSQPATTCLFFSLMSYVRCLFAGGCWLAGSGDSPHLSSECGVPCTAFHGDLQEAPPSCLGGEAQL